MDYIKVTFNEMPRVLFSHKHETAAYTYHFSESDVFLEICYIDAGDLFGVFANGETGHTKAGTLSVSWNKPKTSSSHGEFHRHFTVAIGGQYRTDLLSQKEATETLKKKCGWGRKQLHRPFADKNRRCKICKARGRHYQKYYL